MLRARHTTWKNDQIVLFLTILQQPIRGNLGSAGAPTEQLGVLDGGDGHGAPGTDEGIGYRGKFQLFGPVGDGDEDGGHGWVLVLGP